jgi:Arc/MetJ-type ribon-helix-helix transcriptional regulator
LAVEVLAKGGAAMSIEIKPDTERLVHEEIQSGHFRSVDELIVEGVHAWREKHATQTVGQQKGTLSEFLLNSPLPGSELNLERDTDPGRTVRL